MSIKRTASMRAAALDRFGGVETIQMKTLPVPEPGLDEVLRVKQGESVLVFGAGGGIGHLAVQLAKRMGARVLAVASGEDGVALVKRLGADAVVNGRKEDVEAAAHAFAPSGIDAALVTAGGGATDRALRAFRDNGRVAYPNGVM